MRSLSPGPCVDGSDDHMWDPMPPQGWRCRDCKTEILLVGEPAKPGRIVHVRRGEAPDED